MFEEAFEIYKKFGLKSQAIRVLLDHQGDLNRAFEYAGKVSPHSAKAHTALAVHACTLLRISLQSDSS